MPHPVLAKTEAKPSNNSPGCPGGMKIYSYSLPPAYNTDVETLLETKRIVDGQWGTGPGLTENIYDWKGTMLDFTVLSSDLGSKSYIQLFLQDEILIYKNLLDSR
jgi:hypothetical protein